MSRLLAEAHPLAVHLEADRFWDFIHRGWVPPWEPESRHQNETVIDAVAGAAARYASGGYVVVLDGIVGPWFVDRVVAEASRWDLAVAYVVLRPDADVTRARATARGRDALTTEGPVDKMYEAFRDLGRFEANVVDSSAMSPAETVAHVRARLDAGTFAIG